MGYQAQVGYDMCTGNGTPTAALFAALVAGTLAPPTGTPPPPPIGPPPPPPIAAGPLWGFQLTSPFRGGRLAFRSVPLMPDGDYGVFPLAAGSGHRHRADIE